MKIIKRKGKIEVYGVDLMSNLEGGYITIWEKASQIKIKRLK
jgi:hypothetical protein